jgi:hypothetical protein
MAYSSFYDDLDRLGEVDWTVVRSRQWADTVDDGDRKRRKQAEFLVRDALPIELLTAIVVRTPQRRGEVETLLERRGIVLKVLDKPDWYY